MSHQNETVKAHDRAGTLARRIGNVINGSAASLHVDGLEGTYIMRSGSSSDAMLFRLPGDVQVLLGSASTPHLHVQGRNFTTGRGQERTLSAGAAFNVTQVILPGLV